MQKNVSGQKIKVFAFNTTTNNAVTGDAGNITVKVSNDWAAAGALTDINPTETEDGYYLFDVTQAESNYDNIDVYPESSTSNIQVLGCPSTIVPVPQNHANLGIESDGDLTKVNLCDSNTDMRGTDGANTTVPDAAGTAPTAAENFTAVLTTQMTEAYSADGVAPTLAQAIFLIQQVLTDFANSGTTKSVKGLDGTTEKATFTYDDADNPTSITRAT